VLPLACCLWGHWGLDPYSVNPDLGYAPPSLQAWAGRDQLGRDLFARLVLGTGNSVLASILSIGIGMAMAMLIGVVSGWRAGSWADGVLGYIKSLLFTVPFFLIAVAISAVLQPGFFGVYAIVGLVMWAPAARIVRAEAIRVRESRSVIASRAFGLSSAHIFWRCFLPQCVTPPAIALLYLLPELLGLDVGLSFFGLGATPPQPSLGRQVFEGVASFPSAWWLVVIPALVLAIICLTAYHLLGKLAATSS